MRLATARAALLNGDANGPQAGQVPASLPGDATAAWMRARASSCAAHPAVVRCIARFDALLAAYAPQRSGMADTPADLSLPTCAELRRGPSDAGAAGEAFYRRYPRRLAGKGTVERVALDASALDTVVRYLVCAAERTDYDPVVVDNGLALFVSRRHGSAALARLRALGRDGGVDAAPARRFLEQVRGHLAGPAE